MSQAAVGWVLVLGSDPALANGPTLMIGDGELIPNSMTFERNDHDNGNTDNNDDTNDDKNDDNNNDDHNNKDDRF